MPEIGNLYLIPNLLGESEVAQVLPAHVREVVLLCKHFIVENAKNARHFIKQIAPEHPQSELELFVLNKHTPEEDKQSFLSPCLAGLPMGIISDAGCPAIADPGTDVVRLAHRKGIRVVPLVGPSSLLLSLMASGLNGQSFAFNGYLSIDKSERKAALKRLEKRAKEERQSQLFIETPYRNEALFEEMLQLLSPQTSLCVATNVTLSQESIHTYMIAEWKHKRKGLQLDKQPTIFILL